MVYDYCLPGKQLILKTWYYWSLLISLPKLWDSKQFVKDVIHLFIYFIYFFLFGQELYIKKDAIRASQKWTENISAAIHIINFSALHVVRWGRHRKPKCTQAIFFFLCHFIRPIKHGLYATARGGKSFPKHKMLFFFIYYKNTVSVEVLQCPLSSHINISLRPHFVLHSPAVAKLAFFFFFFFWLVFISSIKHYNSTSLNCKRLTITEASDCECTSENAWILMRCINCFCR